MYNCRLHDIAATHDIPDKSFADDEQYRLYSNVNELKLMKIQGGEKLILNSRTLSLMKKFRVVVQY
jgi:hypothetical protein